MLITHIPSNRPYIHELLVANGVVGRQIVGYALAPQRSECDACCMVFDTLNSGLHYCEEQLLEVAVQYHVCQVMLRCVQLDLYINDGWSEFETLDFVDLTVLGCP